MRAREQEDLMEEEQRKIIVPVVFTEKNLEKLENLLMLEEMRERSAKEYLMIP